MLGAEPSQSLRLMIAGTLLVPLTILPVFRAAPQIERALSETTLLHDLVGTQRFLCAERRREDNNDQNERPHRRIPRKASAACSSMSSWV